MNRAGGVTALLVVVAVLCGAGLQPAGARAPLVFDIPGVSAPTIAIGGVERLDDGGALVAATLGPSRSRGASRLALVRLRLDGSPDLAYGTLGIASVPVGDARATTLAVNPSTAEAWVGVAQGRGDRGEILAVDGDGRFLRGFGRHGRIALRGGAPVALAWRPGQLFVAMGRSPCGGCTVALASSRSGRFGPARHLVPHALITNNARCSARSISGVLFTPDSDLLLAVDATGPGCGAGVVQASPAALIASGSGVSVAAPFGTAAGADALGALGSQTCVGGAGPRDTEFGALDRHNAARPIFRGPAGELVSVVALGRGGCAVLIRGRGGTVVLQAASRGRPTRDAVSHAVEPLGMVRCHQHLLVLGARRARGAAAMVVAVVPVRRGPFATAAATKIQAAPAGGSGCR
ncbi:MAG TPA: hypothetical protein VMU39_19630 [Solirubrobacteraceae bacterium]|nr:hypothetical protein [Solirubrobacteraceae bacterium]